MKSGKHGLKYIVTLAMCVLLTITGFISTVYAEDTGYK